MEPIVFASIIVSLVVSASLLAGAALIARAIGRRLRTPDSAVPGPAPSPNAANDGLAPLLARIERRLGRLEKAARAVPKTPIRPPDETPPGMPAAVATAEPVRFGPTSTRTQEIRRLSQRGRNPVEIAQLVDADVGEVELVLRLDQAIGSPER